MSPPQAQSQATQGRGLSTLAPLRALRARTSEPAWPQRAVGEGVKSCPRAGWRKSACPVRKLGDLGFLGLNKPVEYGGQGLDYSYAMVMAEELGGITCGGVPMAIGVQTDMATPALARFGSDEVKRTFLAPSIAGDFVACLGVSEVGAGSDVASIRTTARKDGDDYRISGGKMWTTNGAQADWMCLLANTSDGPVHHNKTL